jgi:2-methylcitrate dehydratase
MVLKTVQELSGSGKATIFGKSAKTTTPLAALANGVAIRYQDYNDVYIGLGWTGHPSDCIATLLAVAEAYNCSGRDFLLAMVAAYEVHMRFADLPCPKLLWHRGWHHSAMCAYSGAAGAGKLLGLDAGQMAHALALSGARSNTFSEIRHGDIPMDKALSAPIVASQSILYVLLARQGFTGCSTLLEGPFGFRYAVAGGVDVEPLVPQKGDFRTLKVGLKPYPVEGMTPAMVEAAVEIKNKFNVVPDEIESIRILSFEETMIKPSWDERKLHPTTKETADHSFYYCVAVALMAGECTSEQFNDEWLCNPKVAALIAKMRLEEKPEFTVLFKKESARPAAVEVTTRRGVFYHEVLYPKGVPQNPMTWADVNKKFVTQAEAVLGSKRVQEVMDRALVLEKEANMRSFVEMLGGQINKK